MLNPWEALGAMIGGPRFFFSSLANLFELGYLSVVPLLGTIMLVVGILIGIVDRKPQLMWFILPFIFSEVFLGFAGLLRGFLSSGLAHIVAFAFLLFQAIVCGYLIRQLEEARFPASLLAFFSMTYTIFACILGVMSLANSWI